MTDSYGPLAPSPRLLLGPGPSQISPRVLRAASTPLLGYLDPEFLALMDQIQTLLREAFQTANTWTMCVPGTGMAGMEAAMVNLLEPDDELLVCVQGLFGERMCDVARRAGARVRRIDAAWGEAVRPEQLVEALKEGTPKVVSIVHAETSTGVLQPLQEIAPLVRDAGALLVVDCVTSLGGMPVEVDARGIDLAYSGTQKCVGAPPSLAPITLSARAIAAYQARTRPVSSFYLDAGQIWRYWGPERAYHQTGMGSMLYALREALLEVHEEGLDLRYARHRTNQRALIAGLKALGLQPLVQDPTLRLPSLTTVRVPEGVDDKAVRGQLLAGYGIEIGGGLGQFAGKVWRIGLMGYASQRPNVILLLSALADLLERDGGDALAAAAGVYSC